MAAASQKRRVLIVDDDVSVLDIVSASLEAADCSVLVAMTGEAALRAVRRVRPDLIVLDIGLPDMDGFQLCELLRSELAEAALPIVFLTASDATDAEARSRLVGGSGFIRKQLAWSVILECIRSHLKPLLPA